VQISNQPFLSCRVLVDILLHAGMLQHISAFEVARQVAETCRRSALELPDTFDTAREVCNYDLAVSFTQQMWDFASSSGDSAHAEPEIVYHWTNTKNFQSIVNNNLQVAGESNADGSRIAQAHGAVHGRGIYAADNIRFGRGYGGGAPCALLWHLVPCFVLPCRAKCSTRALWSQAAIRSSWARCACTASPRSSCRCTSRMSSTMLKHDKPPHA